jgi:two-component system chemotaxis response regulator CheY
MARSFIRRCLEIALAEEVEFAEAADGAEALALMKERPPDLLVTDLNMPGMDGARLLAKVMASPRLHGTPSIVITSLRNPARVAELEARGVTAVLGKPVEPQELGDALERIFGKGGEDGERDGFGS